MLEPVTAEEQLLDSAERCFYAYGFQAVGMDALRADSGLSLKRIYQLYPSKDEIMVAMLRRRDVRWRASLREWVNYYEDPRERLLSVFDWLYSWFSEPDFRGCAWINAFGELSGTAPAVAEEVRRHKAAFRRYLRGLATEAGCTKETAAAVYLLAEGAMVSAAIQERPKAATDARVAVETLLG
jgi:AcrR family transcriptional regulator